MLSDGWEAIDGAMSGDLRGGWSGLIRPVGDAGWDMSGNTSDGIVARPAGEPRRELAADCGADTTALKGAVTGARSGGKMASSSGANDVTDVCGETWVEVEDENRLLVPNSLVSSGGVLGVDAVAHDGSSGTGGGRDTVGVWLGVDNRRFKLARSFDGTTLLRIMVARLRAGACCGDWGIEGGADENASACKSMGVPA